MARRFKVAVTLGTLASLTIVGVGLLMASADSEMKQAIEIQGKRMIGAKVTVARVDLLPQPGRATIAGVVVANPPGFRSEDALHMSRVRLDYNLSSLAGPVLTVRRVLIEAPQIYLEAGLHGTNFDVLGRNLARTPFPSRTGGRGNWRIPQLFVVEEVLIRDAAITVTSDKPDMRRVGVHLPEVRIAGIGREEGGLPPDAILGHVLGTLNEAMDARGLVPSSSRRGSGAGSEDVAPPGGGQSP